MRDLRVAFWTNKGNFALCPTSSSEVAATQGAAPRPRVLLKKVVGNFCAFCQHKTFVSGFLMTLIKETPLCLQAKRCLASFLISFRILKFYDITEYLKMVFVGLFRLLSLQLLHCGAASYSNHSVVGKL